MLRGSRTVRFFGAAWVLGCGGAAFAQTPGPVPPSASIGCIADSSPTASTCVKRDSNANSFANNFVGNATTIVTSGSPVLLTAASPRIIIFTGSTAQTVQLPDATTVTLGTVFYINNNSSASVTINNNGGSLQYTIPPGGDIKINVLSISSADGSWDFHAAAPSAVTWGSGTNGLIFNTALSTSPKINTGAASSTSPAFIPQSGTATTGYSGDSTHLYGVIGSATALTISATGITSSGLSQQNTLTATANGQQNSINFNTKDTDGTSNNWQIGSGITADGVFQLYYPGLGDALRLTKTGGLFATNAATSAATQTGYWCYDASKQLIADSTACLTSSRRFKQDIKPLAPRSALQEVLHLRPVSFRYKPSFNGKLESNPNFNGQQVGLIAEDVVRVDPRLVEWDEQSGKGRTPHGVRYENAVALLAGAVQAQQAEIAALRRELTELKGHH